MKYKKKIKKFIWILIGVLVAAVIAFPIVWILPAVFKDKSELFRIPNTFFPENFTLENIIKVLQVDINDTTLLQSIGATLLVAILSTFFSLFINMFAAYAFARLDFRGKNFLWVYVMFSMFIPGITIQLTSIRVVNILNLVDTIGVLIIPGLANAYNIFFFRQFFYGIPESIEEAAMIDGASRLGIFFRIFLPMSTTPMVIIGMGVFMGAWNSFVWPTLTITNNPKITQIMQIIRSLNASYSGEYGVVIAATLISLIIPIALFAIFQKKILEGISLTGLK